MSEANSGCPAKPLAVRIDNDAALAKNRLVHLTLLNLNLRFMENWRLAQVHSGALLLDQETLFILMAIVVIAAERVLRDELECDLQCLVQELPASKLGKVNFSSIAAATGVNRETVRRKVRALQHAGWVLRDKEGIRPVPGVIPYDALREIIDAQLDALTRVANQLARLGVLVPKQ